MCPLSDEGLSLFTTLLIIIYRCLQGEMYSAGALNTVWLASDIDAHLCHFVMHHIHTWEHACYLATSNHRRPEGVRQSGQHTHTHTQVMTDEELLNAEKQRLRHTKRWRCQTISKRVNLMKTDGKILWRINVTQRTHSMFLAAESMYCE